MSPADQADITEAVSSLGTRARVSIALGENISNDVWSSLDDPVTFDAINPDLIEDIVEVLVFQVNAVVDSEQ